MWSCVIDSSPALFSQWLSKQKEARRRQIALRDTDLSEKSLAVTLQHSSTKWQWLWEVPWPRHDQLVCLWFKRQLHSSVGMCGGEIKAAIVSVFLWWPQLAVCLPSCQLAVPTDTVAVTLSRWRISLLYTGKCCFWFCLLSSDLRELKSAELFLADRRRNDQQL